MHSQVQKFRPWSVDNEIQMLLALEKMEMGKKGHVTGKIELVCYMYTGSTVIFKIIDHRA